MELRSVALIVLASVLGGCASQHQSGAKILVSDGCMVSVEGLSAAQADDLMKTWEFADDCSLKVKMKAEDDEEL